MIVKQIRPFIRDRTQYGYIRNASAIPIREILEHNEISNPNNDPQDEQELTGLHNPILSCPR